MEAISEQTTTQPRAEVQALAVAMEQKLQEHDDDRGERGWSGDAPELLLARAQQELAELQRAVHRWRGAPWADHFKARVLSEAADVANMVMMVADVCGPLEGPEPEPEPEDKEARGHDLIARDEEAKKQAKRERLAEGRQKTQMGSRDEVEDRARGNRLATPFRPDRYDYGQWGR